MQYTFQFGPLIAYLPQFLSGLWLTMQLSIVGIFGGFALGVGLAIVSTLSWFLPRFLVRCYVEIVRNTPLLVQIFVIFFGLPNIGIRMSPLTSVTIALVFNNAGYIAEIVRGGIQSTHRSQFEAAESLGMTYLQTLRFVILPPALERVFTPVVSQCVLLMLSTSLVSAVGVEDMTGAAMIASSETFRTMEVYLVIAAVYVTLNFIFWALLNLLGLIVFRRSRRKLLGRI
ncbi:MULTISPECIES: amino acid ABC transporter permease [unclassified Rhizobium]|uniref:amino acid ABC transporter permease n=1 Tax=unclassified Rhizobium TaxID=2613769 RepID=UPI00160E982F|nr:MULTISPECIES: amino acid ABC transporter permease [unclassified Rhizobium]MBB3317445.1 polar amino acid transport system permease protein [Rhizobium sp. BK181]MBB3543186.1 polar amino acid transport system permease protein [Rhizobium sp. BK399]MCS3744201.1 polar amino acid transport system permease protein [Rhizobium sp. BK661]MCS4096500.1 polar amino acid transport system permease protein [Rhizobium sp. BK176]